MPDSQSDPAGKTVANQCGAPFGARARLAARERRSRTGSPLRGRADRRDPSTQNDDVVVEAARFQALQLKAVVGAHGLQTWPVVGDRQEVD